MAKPGSHLDLRSDRAGRHNDVRGSEEMSTQPQTDVPAAYPEGAARSPLPFFSRLLTEVIRTGRLTVIDATGRLHPFGPGDSGPDVTVRLCDPLLPLRILLRPSLALGEAYMDGTISIEKGTLRDLLHLCTSNLEALDQHPIGALRGELDRLLRRLQQDNRLARARANIAHHYDLSGALYDLFLDRDRQYSCAYFQTGAELLEDAQEKKKHHIMAKLLLEPGMRVLDVGSGWGGLALEMAQTAGADVTGLTLSQEQLAVATERAVTAGLSSRVRFVMRDYREDQGTYDRIVSVGMFEHVGVAHYRTYFDTLRQRLNPEGIALVHAIGRADPPGSTDPWLRKYIFPGGYCPALSEVLAAVERSGLLGHRHRDPAATLCRDAAALVRALPGQPRPRESHLRRALLSHVGVLPCRLRGRVPQRPDDGVPAPARAPARRSAADTRLHHRLGAPGRQGGGRRAMRTAQRAFAS